MPEFLGKILVVTVDELVPEFYNTYNTLKSELYRYKDKEYGIKRAMKGGKGRKLLVIFDSLPKEYQEVIGDPRCNDHILEKYYAIDSEAVEYYHSFQYPDKKYLKPTKQEEYIINASVLRALQDLKADRIQERVSKGGGVQGVMNTICQDAITFNDVLHNKYQMHHSLPSNYRRFREKYNQFEQDGYVALIKDAKGKSKQNARKTNAQVLKLLNDLFATQADKPTATYVAMQYQAFLENKLEVVSNTTGEVYSSDGFPAIGGSTITKYLKKWESEFATLPVRGNKKLDMANKFKLPHMLYHPKFSGSIISIDDRNPPFNYYQVTKSGKKVKKRVWFYMALDVASDAFICWVHAKSKEALIVEFYRQLCRNLSEWGLNMPWELECEMSLNSTYKSTMLMPGRMFQNVRIEANNPWGKIVETRFKPLRYGLEKSRIGWMARPAAKSESNMGGDDPGVVLEYDDIVNNALADVVTWNNMEHRNGNNMSRWEYFVQNQHPDLKPINWQGILPWIGHKTISSVHRGQVNFRNTLYLLGDSDGIVLGDKLIRLMTDLESKDIDIRWLDGNYGECLAAIVLDADGRYICNLHEKPSYNRSTLERTPEDEKARQLMSAYETTIREFGKRIKGEIEPVTVIDHRPKTVSDTFMIPGVKKYEEREHEVEVLADYDNEHEYSEDNNTNAGDSWRNNFKI